MYGRKKILFIGSDQKMLPLLSQTYDTEVVPSVKIADTILFNFIPDMIIFDSTEDADIKLLRKRESLLKIPVLIISESFDGFPRNASLLGFSNVLLCNTAVARTKPFLKRISEILEKKKNILPAKTGQVVKEAILFINKNFKIKLSREVLSGCCKVSEDYLSRIFAKEMGLPLGEYLTIFRLSMATLLLQETSLSAKEVALSCGFASDSYFNKAFKKFCGTTPNSLRK